MPHRLPSSSAALTVRSLLALATLALPSLAAAAPDARLVHCGAHTCLRLTGSRADAAVLVRVAGRAMPVEGARSWRVDLPLAATSGIADPSGQTVTITLADPRTGTERTDTAILPPGALGKPVELASLTVYAH
ncbi:hypothetical protein ACT009_13660 [Sphingomonas sp. Tas61C01]|uniref:hypothetical protein n=1 Tax=Sphingomonas sp. Tas61C01 TaxID=3458297 RepID=UPI00403E7548